MPGIECADHAFSLLYTSGWRRIGWKLLINQQELLKIFHPILHNFPVMHQDQRVYFTLRYYRHANRRLAKGGCSAQDACFILEQMVACQLLLRIELALK